MSIQLARVIFLGRCGFGLHECSDFHSMVIAGCRLAGRLPQCPRMPRDNVMKWLKLTLLMWAALGAGASAGELADAKNSFNRWMGCGYSDGYHASKCYRWSHCSCACVPYSPHHPRNPAPVVGQSYFSAAHWVPCGDETCDANNMTSTVRTAHGKPTECKPTDGTGFDNAP